MKAQVNFDSLGGGGSIDYSTPVASSSASLGAYGTTNVSCSAEPKIILVCISSGSGYFTCLFDLDNNYGSWFGYYNGSPFSPTDLTVSNNISNVSASGFTFTSPFGVSSNAYITAYK